MAKKTRDQSLQTKQNIMEVAKNLFRDNGYDRTNLSEIAEKAGVTRGAVYWHFKNKDDLFISLWHEMTANDNLFYFFDTIDKNESILLGLRRWILHIKDDIKDHEKQTFLRLIYAFIWGEQGNERIRKLVNDQHIQFKRDMKTVLIKARDHGELPSDLNVQLASDFMSASIEGAIMCCLQDPESYCRYIEQGENITPFIDAMLGQLPFLVTQENNGKV